MKRNDISCGCLIVSQVLGIVCSLMMICIYDYSTEDQEEIWMGSKVLTMKELINNNTHIKKPILDIKTNLTLIKSNYDYEYLLKHSKKDCDLNYKKCGILDTLGNILCIPREENCPVNDIKVGLISENATFLEKNYSICLSDKLDEGYALYYTNTAINNPIIVDIKFSESTPLYINEDNFILDQETFDDLITDDDDDYYYDYDRKWDFWDYWDYFINIQTNETTIKNGIRKLKTKYEKEVDLIKYMDNKMKENKNIDKSYKNINKNLYAGTYIGFQDSSQMSKYIDLDLYNTYFVLFPNTAALVFCYIGVVYFILLICIVVGGWDEDKKKPGDFALARISVTFFHFIYFIGYFIYTLYENSNIYNDRKIEELPNIKADPFLEDFLAEIKERHPSQNLILSIISLYSISFGLVLLSWFNRCCKEDVDPLFKEPVKEKAANLV